MRQDIERSQKVRQVLTVLVLRQGACSVFPIFLQSFDSSTHQEWRTDMLTFQDCQIKAWRGKGHKADCELLAQHRDLRDLFVLEWDVFEDFYRFPLNLLL